MNTVKDILEDSVVSDKLFFESPFRTNYLWKNLIIEQQASMGKRHKYYGRNLFSDVWSLLTSSLG